MRRLRKLACMAMALCMALTMLPITALTAGGETNPVTLRLGSERITITPTGYKTGDGAVTPYTGAYIITGTSEDIDTALDIVNKGTVPWTVNMTLQDVNITSGAFNTALRASGPVVLNLTNKGTSSIMAGNHAALSGDNLTVNLHVSTGSLTLGRQDGQPTHVVHEQNVTLNLLHGTEPDYGGNVDNTRVTKFVMNHVYQQNADGKTHSCTLTHGCSQQDMPCSAKTGRDNGDDTHSAACDACGGNVTQAHDQTGRPKDNGDGTHSATCSVCGMVNSTAKIAHTPASDVSDLGNGAHAKLCTNCAAVIESTRANHDGNGPLIDRGNGGHSPSCTVCGAESEETTPHALVHDADTQSNEFECPVKCTGCGYTTTQEHQFGEATVTQQPGADTPGKREKTCQVCGDVYSGPIAPTSGWWVRLCDRGQDTWNGASLAVWIDGQETKFSIEDGAQWKEFLLPGSPDSEIVLIFYKGLWDHECGVELYAPGSLEPGYREMDLDSTINGQRLYANFTVADYSKVESALGKIPQDLFPYTWESVQRLQAAIDAVGDYVSDKHQQQVDAWAAAIETAIAALELEPEGEDPFAQAVEITLRQGDKLVITATGYSLNGGEETPHTGPYSLTSENGQPVEGSVWIKSGRHRIALNSLKLTNSTGSPFAIAPGAWADIVLTGENSLIVTDEGHNLSAGLNVPARAYLTLRGQGSLTAHGGSNSAGIGGNEYESAGNITIYSGTIRATSDDDGAGIGGGYKGGAGHIVIYDGTIHAECLRNDGAGIGCGEDGMGGAIAIYGGHITALSLYDDGAAIGGADRGKPDSIFIAGGTIIAKSKNGAAIGGGDDSNGGVITITDGLLTLSSVDGAAIGGGLNEAGGKITMTGGVIVIEGHGGNIIGNDAGDNTAEGPDNFVILSNVSIFSDAPSAIFPQPKSPDGQKLVAAQWTTSRQDGFVALLLPGGGKALGYVRGGKISVYLPEGVEVDQVTLGDPGADYSAVDAALKKIPANLDDYTADSVAKLKEAQQAVKPGLLFPRQEEVDQMARKIEQAIAELVLKNSPTPPPGESTTVPGDQPEPSGSVPSENPGATPLERSGSPSTGDNSAILAWLLLLLASGGAALTILARARKKHTQR